ncbi:MAG: hypothetical protein HKN50_07770 [Gammaproteobacteria bacterium]|nr:hypothetical protein [Gammaproteobacteria bacterium]
MLNKVISTLVLLAAILFIVNGLRWLIDPAGIVDMFGLQLATGVGLSTQIGDMSEFFFTLGTCMALGVVLKKAIWLYPAMMLLVLAATGRIIAWLVHDAAFATSLIVPEILIATLLLITSRQLRQGND